MIKNKYQSATNKREEEFKKRMGVLIKQARLLKAMKQKTLARLTNCTPSHLSQIENGRCGISLKLLNKILDALKVIDRAPFFNLAM